MDAVKNSQCHKAKKNCSIRISIDRKSYSVIGDSDEMINTLIRAGAKVTKEYIFYAKGKYRKYEAEYIDDGYDFTAKEALKWKECLRILKKARRKQIWG